jgi:hypothetical protein
MALTWDGVVAQNKNWGALAYSPTLKRWLGVSGGALFAVPATAMISDDDGATWSLVSGGAAVWPDDLDGDGHPGAGCQFHSLCWDTATQQFLGTGISEEAGDNEYLMLYTSPDGETWHRSLIAHFNSGGLFGNGIIVANGPVYMVTHWTSSSGTLVYTSSDLATWTRITVPADMLPGAAIWSGQFVVVGKTLNHLGVPTPGVPIITSPDGAVWTGQMGFEVGFVNKAWVGLKATPFGFVAVAAHVNGADAAMTSGDAETWTLQAMPALTSLAGTLSGWSDLEYLPRFGCVAINGNSPGLASEGSAVSLDGGVTWALVATTQQAPPSDVTSGATQFTCLRAGGNRLVAASAKAQLYHVLTQLGPVKTFYRNPGTDHFVCVLDDPGAPWELDDPTLSITSVDPAFGPEEGGTSVTITGTGFADGALVTIGGADLVDLVVVDAETITGVTPPGDGGPADVVVTNPADCAGDVDTAVGAFNYGPFYDDGASPAGGVIMGSNDQDGIGAPVPVGPIDVDHIPCATETTIVCNLALARLGVNRQIVDITADSTQEAILARLHFNTDVDVVLSAFPWEFARRYNGLVVVSGSLGSPVNADWAFAYRRPADCVFERRIVGERGVAVNPTSPPFALSSDTDGGLILSNEPNAVLEYTYRPACAASAGDALFIEALIWKLGASLAAPLTRIPGKSEECFKQFEGVVARAYDVQRPGNPGPPPAAATIDTAVTATAANLSVVNRALIRIGARTIGALSDQSREATAVRLLFEDELQTVLRDFPWAFATRYAELAAVAGPVTWDNALVQVWDVARTYEEKDVVSRSNIVYYALRETVGDDPTTSASDWTTTEPQDANADWIHAYRTPADLLAARRLVKEMTRRVYDDNPFPFRVGTDDGGELLYTDAEQAVLEYTARIDAAVLRGDALFKDAFAWRLASDLALTLAQVDPDEVEQRGRGTDAMAAAGKQPAAKANNAAARQRVAQWALGQYAAVMERAKDANANENQAEKTGDAPWIEERGGGRIGGTRTRAPWEN